jgi:putative transposase
MMGLIDKQYTRFPYYGVPRMTAWLRREGHDVNHKRIERLMRIMGIQGVCPKRNLSKSDEQHKKYPYLLKNLEIVRPNQVWSSDITYIRLSKGFAYLVAVMDWFSRYVLSWRLSNTLDTQFCIDALDVALQKGRPDIFNTDQGVQFTSNLFTSRLIDKKIQISMDGKGRAFDNIFIERLWRSVKYEEVYLKAYQTVSDAFTGIDNYFKTFNMERLHQSLKYRTPYEVHYNKNFTLQ